MISILSFGFFIAVLLFYSTSLKMKPFNGTPLQYFIVSKNDMIKLLASLFTLASFYILMDEVGILCGLLLGLMLLMLFLSLTILLSPLKAINYKLVFILFAVALLLENLV